MPNENLDLPSSSKTIERSKSYPAVTLNEAFDFVLKLKDYPLGKPIAYANAAKANGYDSKDSKGFRYPLSAARQYGLLETASGDTLTITDLGKKVLFPTGESDSMVLKRECFMLPVLHKFLIESYDKRSLPTQNILENVLRTYGIANNVVSVAATCFIISADQAGLVHSGILDVDRVPMSELASPIVDTPKGEEKITNEKQPIAQTQFHDQQKIMPGSLVIPMSGNRQAIITMPVDTSNSDAEYVKQMISIMFKQLYDLEVK